jgi:hypothetical protein
MFNKMNARWLAIAFAVLLLVALFVFFINDDKKDQSFKSELTDFNVEEVDKMNIFQPNGADPLYFEKNAEGIWTVMEGDNAYNASEQKMVNMLNSLKDLKAKRLAAKGEKSWSKYDVNDSLAIRVEVLSGNKGLAHVYIGKFKYSQAPAQAQNPYQQGQGTMTNFVRLAEEEEVYVTDGFLKMTFQGDVESFRNQIVTELKKEDIGQINVETFGNGFSLKKNDDAWLMDGIAAESILPTPSRLRNFETVFLVYDPESFRGESKKSYL